MKKILIIFSVLFVLLISSIGVMYVAKFCPPAGPWPNPPWCSSKNDVLEIKNAITISTDITKINYPSLYINSSTSDVEVKDPFCAITKDDISYPIEYLGSNVMPQITGDKLSTEISRTVGIKDTWIPEPNLNEGCYSNGYSATKQAYEKTLERIKLIGADQISFSNYVHFSNFANAEIDSPDKAAVSEDDLRFVANKAKEQNLKITLYLNLAPGDQTVSDIPNSIWLSNLIDNWSLFVLNQAEIAEEVGIDSIMINHFDYQPSIKGFEDTYQKKMVALLEKVRLVYSGDVLLAIDPIWGANLDSLSNLLNQIDGYIYTPKTDILRDTSDKSVSVDNLRKLYFDNFSRIGNDFGKYNKPINLRILIQSSKRFLESGWDEDMFCIVRDGDQCYQKNLEVDFSAQAIAYEAMLEAINQSHGNSINVSSVDAYGYWFTDVIMPDYSQPQISQSIRNKPAESIVMAWFM